MNKSIRWTKEAVKGVINSFAAHCAIAKLRGISRADMAKGFRKMLIAMYGKEAVTRLLTKIEQASARVSAHGAEWYILCTSQSAGNFFRNMMMMIHR